MGQASSQDAEKRDPKSPNEKDDAQASEKRRKRKKKKRRSGAGNTVQMIEPNKVSRSSLGPSLSVVSPLYLRGII